jgi:hypothetical protein
MPIRKSTLRRVIREELRRELNEAMGGNQQMAVYDSDRKTKLGSVSRQTTSIGVAKKFAPGKSAQMSKVDGKYAWVIKEADFRGSAHQAKFKDLKPNQLFRMADDPSTATLMKTKDGGYEVVQPGDSGASRGMKYSKRDVDPNQRVIPGIVRKG